MKLLKFLIDADMPKSSKKVIENFGHEVIDVRDISLGNASDQEIIEYAFSNKRIIVTRDLDFGNIISRFLKSVDEEKIINAVTIVELGRYRIRR